MDAGPLDVLHDAGDQHVRAVRDDIHLQLDAGHVLVHQDGIFDAAGQDAAHVGLGGLAVPGDAHVLAADDIAGAKEHRIAQVFGRGEGFVQGVYAVALRAADAEALQQGVEAGPVLGGVNAVGGGSQDGDPLFGEKAGQLDGRLAAEGHHHPHRLFHPDNIPDVFRAEGLKVEPIGGVVVGGDGLGVVVHDDHVVAHLPQGPDAVDRAVVELDALADPDGAGAQDHDHGLSAAREAAGFAERIAGRVEIGCLGVELGRTGVHHLVREGGFRRKRRSGETAQGGVGIAQSLGKGVILAAQRPARNTQLKGGETFQLPKEEEVDLRKRMNLFRRYSLLQGFENRKEPVVILIQQPRMERTRIRGWKVQTVQRDFRAAHRLHQGHLEAWRDGHHLTRGFHLGPQTA